jgi:hypothetical protein
MQAVASWLRAERALPERPRRESLQLGALVSRRVDSEMLGAELSSEAAPAVRKYKVRSVAAESLYPISCRWWCCRIWGEYITVTGTLVLFYERGGRATARSPERQVRPAMRVTVLRGPVDGDIGLVVEDVEGVVWLRRTRTLRARSG